MTQKNQTNSEIENYNFDSEDFSLCQQDKKIYDVKLESKPTTFAKDAFKRFRKNKSSVIGAYIIGLLIILAILVPIVSPYDVDEPHPEYVLLPPKLFNSGTGFWDGTKVYKNMLYDKKTETVVGDFDMKSVYDLKITEEKTIDTPTFGAMGGQLIFSVSPLGSINPNDAIKSLITYDMHTYTVADQYKMLVEMNNLDNYKDGLLGEYQIVLKYTENETEQSIVLKDWSKDYSTYTIDISQILKSKNKMTVQDAQIAFNLKGYANSTSYIMFNKVEFTTASTDAAVLQKLLDMSMLDANQKALLQKDQAGIFPPGYWQAEGSMGIANAKIYYSTFRYDEYLKKFGDKEFVIDDMKMKEYIAKGYCTYDYTVGPSSFVKLSEKCPINSVISQKDIEWESGYIYEFNCNTTMYRYYGFNSMPRFLVGTDEAGKDLLTISFSFLKTSLIIAFLASAICFAFGLCWGAISGYFGGNIDLFMERFCDILGGVPWIVVMTLAILLLGNNVATLVIALCLTNWLGVARRTRTQFYRFKGREYVLASRTLGAKDKRLIFRHILPNAMGTIVTSSILMIPGVIFAEATLAYLGLIQGLDSFGLILSNNQKFLSSLPMLIIFPSVIISLIMISFNLFGNGLRDALNPSLKGSE